MKETIDTAGRRRLRFDAFLAGSMAETNRTSLITFVKIWLWISAGATVAGWLLSAIGELNRAGYILVFGAAAALAVVCCRPAVFPVRFGGKKLLRRFTRPVPAYFLALALLVLVGGLLYPPSNYTALSYRIPRVLHWLSEEQWHWIHSENFRMNNRAAGIEWLSAPLLLFTRSDRALFLINFIPFLLLPGLLFSVFTRLGVKPRTAWNWMWLVPTGYNFLLQAGSTANDTFPAVYALAAIDFACRAHASRRVSDLCYSMLAAALLTGAKASNLPLLLPWFLLVVPLVPLVRQRPVISALAALVAALVSFLPTAVLNIMHCGDWSGLVLEREGMAMRNPIVGILGNPLLLIMGNLLPPFFPMAGWWNQSVLALLPGWIANPLVANFEQGFHLVGELPTEDTTGLGFGVSFLLIISLVASTTCRKLRGGSPRSTAVPSALRKLVLIAPWISLLAYCAKSGMVTPARLIAPYYPLLLPALLLAPGHAVVVRRRWWRVLVAGNFLLAAAVLLLTPGRPLWPAETVLSKAAERYPDQRLIARARNVYRVYSTRADSLAAVRELLPPDAAVIGFMGTEDDASISLWRPYLSRTVKEFRLKDPPEAFRRQNIQYVAVGGFNLSYRGTTLEDWLKHANATLIATTNATLKVSEGPQPWHIVKLND